MLFRQKNRFNVTKEYKTILWKWSAIYFRYKLQRKYTCPYFTDIFPRINLAKAARLVRCDWSESALTFEHVAITNTIYSKQKTVSYKKSQSTFTLGLNDTVKSHTLKLSLKIKRKVHLQLFYSIENEKDLQRTTTSKINDCTGKMVTIPLNTIQPLLCIRRKMEGKLCSLN